MNFRLGKKIGLAKPADFLGLVASWFLFGAMLFPSAHTAPGIYTAWIFLASFLSLFSLGAIGYFEHHIPKPDLSGLVSLLFALPFSALLAKWLLMLTSHLPPVRYSEMLWAAIGVALLFEAAQLIAFKIHRATGAKWTLIAHLHPDELAALRSQVEESGNAWWIQIHPHDLSHSNGNLRGDETLVISRRAAHQLQDCRELLTGHLRGQRIVDVRQLLQEFRSRVDIRSTDGWTFLLGSTHQGFLIRFYFYLKTLFEPALALVLLALLAPFLLIVALAILWTSGCPIFYKQERLGYRGKKFMLHKFRSMNGVAENGGARWASRDDPRVTPLGRWLRRTRIDELPQLLNVVRGDLGFVGPRPERPEFYDMLKQQVPLFSMRLLVRPGVTGWAQVRQGYAASVEECKTKLEYDLYYVQHMSPRLDLRVVAQTAALMARGNGGR